MPEPVDRSWIVGASQGRGPSPPGGLCRSRPPAAGRGPTTGGPLQRAGHGRDVGDGRTITNLPQLLSYLDWSCALIDRADDLAAIAYGTARRATASGVRTRRRDRQSHSLAPLAGSLDAMVDALDERLPDGGDRRFRHRRPLPEPQADPDTVRGARPRRLDARSPASPGGGPVDRRRRDERLPQRAVRRGLHPGRRRGTTAVRPRRRVERTRGVREAIDILGAERIDHGIRAGRRPALVADLARRSIPLDICPTSNVVLGIVPDLDHHPVDDLRRQGVRVSLNTDDPLAVRVDVAGEYALCAQTFGWDRPEWPPWPGPPSSPASPMTTVADELLRELDAFVGAQGRLRPPPPSFRGVSVRHT
jgi:adenosine deaminase